MIDALYGWFDKRLNISGSGRKALNKIFPDHWSFLLGEIALYSFVILLATGVFLSLYFIPSSADTVYTGSYIPLDGTHMSQAFASTVDLSFAVRCGLLMRQMHHWGANIFVGSIVVHMCRVFFTGGYRRPREINWIIGVNLLILAIFNGFLGYSLPDDLVSGTGIRIAFSILESLPLVGSYLATFLFGGQFPGSAIIPRFFIIHVLILPAVIAGLLGAHLFLLVRQKHTQFKGPGATEHNVVGGPMFPTFLAKTNGFLFLVAAVTGILGAAVQINPIWQYGPYVPYHVTYAVQPDWYMGWLDGALRVMPSWETVFAGHMIPNAFWPAIVLPGITFTVMMLWPFVEQRITGDREPHNILQRPRDNPSRTALGAAVLSFYLVLFGASATDVLANYLSLSLNFVLISFRVLMFVVPVIVWPVTYKICKEMQGTPGAGKRKVHNIVMRSPEGGYATVPSAARPGDEKPELTPFPLDIEENGHGDGHELVPAPALVGVVAGAATAGTDGSGDGADGGNGSGSPAGSDGGSYTALAPGAAAAAERPKGRGGIFKIPRNYR
jgi:ubiquinol-cytochrome c reductase cytochrome b subunit